jgi:hypothetical protein
VASCAPGGKAPTAADLVDDDGDGLVAHDVVGLGQPAQVLGRRGQLWVRPVHHEDQGVQVLEGRGERAGTGINILSFTYPAVPCSAPGLPLGVMKG